MLPIQACCGEAGYPAPARTSFSECHTLSQKHWPHEEAGPQSLKDRDQEHCVAWKDNSCPSLGTGTRH